MNRQEFYENLILCGHIKRSEIGRFAKIIDSYVSNSIFSESKILNAILDALEPNYKLKNFALEVPYSKRWIIQKCKPQPKSKHNNRKQKKKRK